MHKIHALGEIPQPSLHLLIVWDPSGEVHLPPEAQSPRKSFYYIGFINDFVLFHMNNCKPTLPTPVYLKTPSKSPAIHWAGNKSFQWSPLSSGRARSTLPSQARSPAGRGPVAAGSCFPPTQRGSAPSGHKALRRLPTRSGARLLRPSRR